MTSASRKGERETELADLVVDEHRQRVDRYRTSEQSLAVLARMNHKLQRGERYPNAQPKRPLIFVFGLPRSGTTLLYQLLSYALDIGYVDNIAARFWRAPLYGLELSQAVLAGRRDDSFVSDLGKSLDPAGPHEFSYFWQHWLNLHTIADLVRFDDPRPPVAWRSLGRVLAAMQERLGRGLVFKTNLIVNHLDRAAHRLPHSMFVYIERDVESVACSIVRARRAYYGDVETWWATYPPDYHALARRPYAEQIAGQVLSLQRTYVERLSRVSGMQQLHVTHRQLCTDPAGVVALVRRQVEMLCGQSVALANAPPAGFQVRTHAADDTETRRVIETLRRQQP